MDQLGKALHSFGDGVGSLFGSNKTSVQVVSPVNLITGVALAALGFIVAISSSPVLGTLSIILGAVVTLVGPDLTDVPNLVSEIFNK